MKLTVGANFRLYDPGSDPAPITVITPVNDEPNDVENKGTGKFAYEHDVGQLLRYVNWIKYNQAEENESVRGIIIAKTISDDLRLGCSEIPNVSLMEYELAVKLNRISGIAS